MAPTAMLFAVCLAAATPLLAALSCYDCSGGSVGGLVSNQDCLDGKDTISTQVCSPSPGEVAKCYLQKTETSLLSIDTTSITRKCKSVASGTADGCTESGDTITCYCSTDNCNGQTTIAPALVTCLISFALALYSFF